MGLYHPLIALFMKHTT